MGNWRGSQWLGHWNFTRSDSTQSDLVPRRTENSNEETDSANEGTDSANGVIDRANEKTSSTESANEETNTTESAKEKETVATKEETNG